MNIEKKDCTVCFFHNRILIVVQLYVLSFSQIVLISHSQLFSFVFEEKKIYHFCSYFSSVLFHTREKKEEEGNSLVSIDSEILV